MGVRRLDEREEERREGEERRGTGCGAGYEGYAWEESHDCCWFVCVMRVNEVETREEMQLDT